MLRAAGLDPDRDVTRQGLGASESADALKDGKIDAFFWSGGLPTAAIQDLAHSQGITIRLLPSDDVLPALQREYGDLYFPLEIPAGAYPGVDQPVPVVGVANVLVVNRSMPDELAYDITRVLFEKKAELAAIHPEARTCRSSAASRARQRSFIQARFGTTPSRRRHVAATTCQSDAVTHEPLEASRRRVLQGWPRRIATALAIGLSLYALYWVLVIVQPQIYRVSFLLVALVLIFLLFPARTRETPASRDRAARLGPRRRHGRRARLAARRLQPLHLSRGRSAAD